MSLRYKFFPLPGQEGGQGDGRPDLSGFNTLLRLVDELGEEAPQVDAPQAQAHGLAGEYRPR